MTYVTRVREFELKPIYYINFRTNIIEKGMNSLIPSTAMG